jgi:hypothetical protein
MFAAKQLGRNLIVVLVNDVARPVRREHHRRDTVGFEQRGDVIVRRAPGSPGDR